MIAVGPSGKIYPCLRYKDYSLESDKHEVVIGNVETGIDFDKVLPFRVATYPTQCDEECLNCEIADGMQLLSGGKAMILRIQRPTFSVQNIYVECIKQEYVRTIIF